MARIVFLIGADATAANQTIAALKTSLDGINNVKVKPTLPTSDVKALTKETDNLKGSLQGVEGQFAKIFRGRIIGKALSELSQATKEALNTMKEVDTQLTNIRKVSGMTEADIRKLGDAAYETASKYGVAADEYLSAVYTFQKAGLGESAAAMGELATKTMLVGDTTAKVAEKFIISANAAWKMNGEMEKLSLVVDQADYINNNYATTLDKLAAGFPVVAATAAQAGMSVEETMAVLGTITSITQETGTKAATAWRALSMNIMGEVGEFITEEGETVEVTTESINSMTDALKKYAPEVIKAAQATGKIVNPLEAVKALSEAYAKGALTDIELQNILMSVGGKLRTNQLTAIVKNFDMYEKMLGELSGAAGTADAEISIMLDSWESKTQILKNEWTQFVSNFLDTGTVKGFLDLAINLVDKLDTGIGRAAVSMGALALAGAQFFGPWGALAGAAVGLIGTIAGAVRDANQEYTDATTKLRDLKNVMDEANETLENTLVETEAASFLSDKYIDRLKELEQKTSLTADEQEEYHNALGRLKELIPDISDLIDTENDKIAGGITLLEMRKGAWLEDAKAAAYAAKVAAYETAAANAEFELALNETKRKNAEQTYNEQIALIEDYYKQIDEWNETHKDPIPQEILDGIAAAAQKRDEASKTMGEMAKAIKDSEETLAKALEELSVAQEVAEAAEKEAENKKKTADWATYVLTGEDPNAAKKVEQETDKAAQNTQKITEEAEAGAEAFEAEAEAAAKVASAQTGTSGKTAASGDAEKDAEKLERAANRAQESNKKVQTAYSELTTAIQKSKEEAVSATEEMLEDIANTLDSGSSETESAAKKAGEEIGQGIGDGIILQSDYIKNKIAQTFSIAKEFIDGLAASGAMSYHPSGGAGYYDRNNVWHGFGSAAGTKNARGGPTLVNELGPELISDNGRAYIANGGKPAVVKLSKGSIVLTAEETKQALKGTGHSSLYAAANGQLPWQTTKNSFGIEVPVVVPISRPTSGEKIDLGNGLALVSNATTVTGSQIMGGGTENKPTGGKGKKKSGVSGASKPNFSKLESALSDTLSYIDLQVNYAENTGDWEQIVRLYEQAQEEIAKLVDEYRKAGYAEDSKEILELLNKNYDYAEKQLDIYRDRWDELIDALDAQNETEKLQKQLEEKRLAVEEARLALENAQKQRTVRVFNSATGQWEWIADQKKIESAQESLAKAEESYADEIKSQAIKELEDMRDTVSDLSDVVLGPALSAVVTMAESSEEFQTFARALDAVFGVGSFLKSTEGSTSVLPTNDSHDTVYSFGGVTLTEDQAATMSLAQLAELLQVLNLTSA